MKFIHPTGIQTLIDVVKIKHANHHIAHIHYKIILSTWNTSQVMCYVIDIINNAQLMLSKHFLCLHG